MAKYEAETNKMEKKSIRSPYKGDPKAMGGLKRKKTFWTDM